jgi:hypothetical protein
MELLIEKSTTTKTSSSKQLSSGSEKKESSFTSSSRSKSLWSSPRQLTWCYITMTLLLACALCYVNNCLNVFSFFSDYYKYNNEILIFDDYRLHKTFENNTLSTHLLSTTHLSTATHVSTRQVTNTTATNKAAMEGRYNASSIADDFDLTASRLDCGWHKCFIPSLSNINIGYLVGKEDPDEQLSKFVRTWEFTKWMDKEIGKGSHFYTDETPLIVELNSTVLMKVNSLVYVTNQKRYRPKYYSMPFVVVQNVRKVYMGDLLFFGCFRTNYFRFQNEKEEYIKNHVIENGHGAEFYKNTGESFNIIRRLFDLKPAMLHDFQALFDNKGHVYFFDLDAQYEMSGKFKRGIEEEKKNCLAKIEGLRNSTIAWKER